MDTCGCGGEGDTLTGGSGHITPSSSGSPMVRNTLIIAEARTWRAVVLARCTLREMHARAFSELHAAASSASLYQHAHARASGGCVPGLDSPQAAVQARGLLHVRRAPPRRRPNDACGTEVDTQQRRRVVREEEMLCEHRQVLVFAALPVCHACRDVPHTLLLPSWQAVRAGGGDLRSRAAQQDCRCLACKSCQHSREGSDAFRLNFPPACASVCVRRRLQLQGAAQGHAGWPCKRPHHGKCPLLSYTTTPADTAAPLPGFQVVVSDKADCGGVAYAQSSGMRVLRYPAARDDPGSGLSAAQLVDALREEGIHLVLLAGYLKLVPAELCRAFPRAMLNIHPALLPAFGGKGMYGHKVHAAVIASGARFSGPTVHFVDEEYDRGKIVAQRCVPVLPDDSPDTLAHRVLEQARAEALHTLQP